MDPASSYRADAFVVPPELEDLYDEDELALIERSRVASIEAEAELRAWAATADPFGLIGSSPWSTDDTLEPVDTIDPADAHNGARVPGRLRRAGSSAMLAGMMLGIGEVFEPEKAKATQIEFAADKLDESEQLVTFEYVKGDPQASRLIIRPWLLERFRR